MSNHKFSILTLFILFYAAKSFSQTNPELKLEVRISTSYSAYNGLNFHFEQVYKLNTKSSLIGSFNTDFNKRKGIGLDYRYKFLKYKKFESNIGLGIFADLIDARDLGYKKKEFQLSIKPVIEIRYNFNKSTYVFGSAKTNINLYNSAHLNYEGQALQIGVAKRF